MVLHLTSSSTTTADRYLLDIGGVVQHQKAGNEAFLDSGGWGFGIAVNGCRFGWAGGLGTDAWADSSQDLVGILLTQVASTSPVQPELFSDFWTLLYAAIEG